MKDSGLATNDVGIITLPEGAGHVAIAVFVKFASQGNAVAEKEIAQTARAIYELFSIHQRSRESGAEF